MTAATECRLTWRRLGLGRRYKLYQSRAAAEKFVLLLTGQMVEYTGLDPDALACCSGRNCGCGGVTNREKWQAAMEDVPPLVEGPTIEARPVGGWAPVSGRGKETWP